MKKLLCTLLTLVLLLGCIGTIAFAETDAVPDAKPDDALVLHWDFEGETPEERLANKAPLGEATDSLVLLTDGTSSVIENGEATIGSPKTEALYFMVGETEGRGKTLTDTVTDEYTLYVRFKVSGQENNTHSPFYINCKKNNGVMLRMYLLRGGFAQFRVNHESAKDTGISDDRINDNEYVAVALTVKKNEDKTVTVTCYQTYDDWGDFTDHVSITTTAVNKSVIAADSDFLFGGGNAWGQDADLGKTYTYDDIRIYNRCLSEEEVMTVNRGEEPVNPPVGPTDSDTGTDPESKPADTKPESKPAETKPEPAPAETTGSGTGASKGGCASGITGTGAAVILAGISVLTLLKRKKKEQ